MRAAYPAPTFPSMPLPMIIHEDAEVLAFDKPSGLLVAPDRWDKTRANLMGMVHADPRLGRSVLDCFLEMLGSFYWVDSLETDASDAFNA